LTINLCLHVCLVKSFLCGLMILEADVTLTWLTLVHGNRVNLSVLLIKLLELCFGIVSWKIPNEQVRKLLALSLSLIFLGVNSDGDYTITNLSIIQISD
jgi:hypothetical protein